MGKNFWKLKTDEKSLSFLVLIAGLLMTAGMGIKAYRDSGLQNGYELVRAKAGEGSYEQQLYASVEGEEAALEVTVEEQMLTEEEAERVFQNSIPLLKESLKGENESLENVSKDLNFAEWVEQTPVEVTWSSGYSDYFLSDGTLREDVKISEPVELQICAILSCQKYHQELEIQVILQPEKRSLQKELSALVEASAELQEEEAVLILPKEYEGKEIRWKKPMNRDFVYFFLLTVGGGLFLKLGRKRDLQEKKKKRMEQLEREYAQVVSKFSMLLSAGLSIRNAWERIVVMEQRRSGEKKAVYEEMNWALREMQKGIPELEVYESFGERVGQIHYKKLMASFVSYKKRGGTNLLELLNEQLLETWEERKRKTRQQGEIIGTKLLIPMMGMLAIVFVMILVPAFLALK